MAYRDILLHLTDDKRSAEKAATAFALAKKHGARVSALYTLPYPSSLYVMGEYVPATYIQQQITDANATADLAKEAFLEQARKAGVKVEWLTSEKIPVEAIEQHGRTFDLVVIGQPDPNLDRSPVTSLGLDGLAADLALSLGRPLLVVPYIGQYGALGKTVAVAWNGGREAARAVHDALPLLEAAESVLVFTINPDEEGKTSAEALVKHLQNHAVKARGQQIVAAGMSAGEALLSALADYSVDLLVMGAYGHSRTREMVLGGVTATLLESMTAPVLLSN